MKSKINLLSRVNPTNGPTVCRRSTDGQGLRHYSVSLTKLLCTLTLLLTLGVGQMGAATRRYYCKMTQSWWTADGAAIGCYAWKSSDESQKNANYPGVRMSSDGNGQWHIDLDTKYDRVIFTRVNASSTIADWGAKTANLTLGSDNYYTITSSSAVWGDPGCTGNWSCYAPTPAIAGDMNDWKPDANVFSGTSGIVTCSITLSANSVYEFKVISGTNWNGYGSTADLTFLGQSGSTNLSSNSGDNIRIATAGAGTYIFTYNTSSRALSVAYPTVTHPSSDYVYFKNTGNWANVKAHVFTGGTSIDNWPGMIISSFDFDGTNYYYAALGDKTSIIFSKSGTPDTKTGDLTTASSNKGKYYDYSNSQWKSFTATLTLDHQGPTNTPAPNSITVTYQANTNLTGDVITTSPAKTGYTFGGYYTSAGGSGSQLIGTNENVVASVANYTDASKNWIKTASATIYAKWTQSVTLDEQGATSSGTTSKSVTYNSSNGLTTMITVPSKTGYDFNGYYTDIAGGGSKLIGNTGFWQASVSGYTDASKKWIKPSGATTIYAYWSQSVTLNSNTSYHGSGANKTATAVWNGTALTSFTATAADTGYEVEGYYTYASGGTKVLNADGTFAADNVTSYITSGKWTKAGATTLYAHMRGKTYTVTLDKNEGDTDGSIKTTYNANTTSNFNAAGRAGYSCDGYFTAADGGTKVINADGTLVDASVTNWLSSGYWVKDAANITLYAHWTENASNYTVTYGVKAAQSSLGSLSCATTTGSTPVLSGGEVVGGTNVTFTASPISGYEVDAWYSDAACTSRIAAAGYYTSTYAPTVNENTIVYVTFKKKVYTITYSPSSAPTGCTYTTKPTSGTYGNTVSMTFTPSSGYTVSVSARDASSNTVTVTKNGNNYTFTQPASAVTVTVTATENKVTLTPTVSYDHGSSNYTASSSRQVGVATTTTLTCSTPNAEHYTFAGWTLTNLTVTSGSVASTSVTVRITDPSQAISAVANYNEVLTQNTWVLKGGTNVTGDNWASEHSMSKNSGASTSDVVYYVANISSTNAGNDGSNAYSFKIIKKGASDTWYGLGSGDGEWWYSRSTGQQTMTTSSKNVQICADVAGDYEIKLDYSTPASPKVTVTFPPSLSFSATSVYSGNASTLTASVGNIVSGKTLKYDVYAGATAEGEPVATYSTTTTATTDSHAFSITPSFGANDSRKQYTVKITYNGTQTATYTSYIGRLWDIYVHDVQNWGQMKLHMWNDAGSKSTYPGDACSKYNESNSWYTVTLDGKYTGFVLSANGDDTKSADHALEIATYPANDYYYVDNSPGGYLQTVSLTDPTVSLNTPVIVNTHQIKLTGTINNFGGDGSSAAEMKEVGFYIEETKYTATSFEGANFTFTVSGLTENTTYNNIKAFAENIHGIGNSATQSATTRAESSYTIKVQVDHGADAPYIYAYTDETSTGGAEEHNAAFPGTQLTVKELNGTVKDWWTFSMSTTYNNFIISNGSSATQSRTFTAPLEEKCYWFIPDGGTPEGRANEMTCPYVEPHLMIETTAGSGNYTYEEMSISPSISKTMSLAAKSTYKFKIVYNGEWFGKASTTLTRASNSASGLDAASGDNREVQITTDAAGDYIFTFTAPGTIEVTYPTAYTITYGIGAINGCAGAIGATSDPSFTSGDYVLRTTAVTFTKGSTANGYQWVGWYSNNDGTGTCYSSADDSWMSAANSRDADMTVYACYSKINYTITYNLNGGTQQVDPAPTTSYTITDAVTLPTPTKEGYRFLGWYDNSSFTGSKITSFAAGEYGNKEYWAKWIQLVTYDVYFYNKDKWATPKAHLWVGETKQAEWPGTAMSYHQDMVYKHQYQFADQYTMIQFNTAADKDDTSAPKTADLTLPPYNQAFYNPEGAGEWTRYIMVAAFPTETIAAVVGEKVTVEPVVAWANGIIFSDINITCVRASGSNDVNAVVAGSKLMVSGTAAGTATFTVTYSCYTTTITKTLTVQIKDGVTIQAKIAKTDTKWTNTAQVKMHYWGTGIGNSNLTMTWMNADADYNYYQASVPFGSDSKANFLFYYDYMKDDNSNRWRQTGDITNVTAQTCYTIGYEGHDNVKSTWSAEAGLCKNSWQLQIVMGSGEIYTSNIVSSSDEIVSFFAPSNANESLSYRQGTVTLELNGSTVETYNANTFSASGVYTAKINTSTHELTDLALYEGDYYIRTDGAAGGWNDYKTNPANKMVYFTRNTNFPNESFSYYWVANVGHGFTQNIKATIANDYNPVLCNFSPDETANEYDGINLRFGYEPTTNDLVRGIVGGSTTNNYLNLVSPSSTQIYKDIDCTIPLDDTHYSETPLDSKFADKSNWVYEIIVYAKIDDDHKIANVILKSYYYGVLHLLGMIKDNYGRETNNPVQFPVIKTGTSNGVYGLRVVYDFKTNRLFGAWAPADRVIDGVLNVDADVMFIRHEDGNAAQISFKTDESKIEDVNQAIFALELDNEDSDHEGSGNIERHYFISLPFDCQVSNIFGLNGFMEYWGVQRYRGDLRAEKGWFKETPTFWEWLDADDVMRAGEGYLLSVDKYALQRDNVWKDGIIYQKQEVLIDEETKEPVKTADGERDSLVWKTYYNGSMITMYFPSMTSGFKLSPATGEELTITYPNQPCTITRDDRNEKDGNWKCIGTPGYKNITVNSYSATTPAVWDGNAAPKFLYEFIEQSTGSQYAKGSYDVTDGSAFTYKSFNSYMVQYAGTINWAQYSKGEVVSPIAARRSKSEESKLTKVQIDLLSEEEESLDRTFVWLQEQATDGFDQNYDLNKMVESKANQIYSIALTDIPFAANVLSLETDTVPLVVNIVNAGEYTFALDKDKHIGQAPILYDMFEGEQTNLLDANYTVELEKGKHEGRFYLLFSPVKPIVTSFETTEDGGLKNHGSEAIYDVLGRRVNTIYPEHLYIVNGEKRIAR